MFYYVSPYKKEQNGTQVIKYTYLLFISAKVYANDLCAQMIISDVTFGYRLYSDLEDLFILRLLSYVIRGGGCYW
jgi:hypothetical protein